MNFCANRPSLALAVASATAMLVGCTGKLNDLDGPFGDELPALRGASTSGAQRLDAPSLSSEESPWASRAAWTLTKVVVPAASVETQSAYRTSVSSRLKSSPAQVVTAQAHAAIDLVLIAPRMIEVAPGTTVRAPHADSHEQATEQDATTKDAATKDATR